MKTLRIALITLMVGLSLVCAQSVGQAAKHNTSDNANKKKVEKTSTERVEFPAGGKIFIHKSFGEVSVEGWDQTGVELTVTKAIRATNTPEKQAEAVARLDRVRVTMVKDKDNVVIHSDVPFRKDLELKYRIKVPRNSALFINHDIGDVEVVNVIGDMNVNNRIGDITIKLPANEQFNVDARARIGDVSSDFGGTNRRKWLIGARANQGLDYKQTAHWVVARIGIGDIQVRKMR